VADKTNLIYDQCLDFSLGMNSGILPRLVPDNQASFLTNVTVRGGFAVDRPAYNKLELTFANDDVETGFEKYLFQGASYYQPDYGDASLRAAIGGRLFQFTPDDSGSASVIELTIPGDPNPPTNPQAWLWQSEKWTIWQDGISIPVFTDEISSRRSLGANTVYGVVAIGGFVIPDVGSVVAVTLDAPYTGDYYVQTLIADSTGQLSFFEIVPPTGINNIRLTCAYDIVGTTHDEFAQVVVIPKNVGYDSQSHSSPGGGFAPGAVSLVCDIGYKFPGTVGTKVQIFNTITGNLNTWKIAVIGDTSITIKNDFTVNAPGFNYPVGSLITLKTSSAPNVVLGTLVIPFVAPNIGDQIEVQMSQPFTGTDGTLVFIGNSAYTIEAIPPPPAGTTVYLLNVDGTSGHNVNAGAELKAVPELPPGRMGAYGLGRNWMSGVDGRTYAGFDIVGGGSGSAAFNYRDAVLKNTENTYLAGGGAFVVPGSVGDIRAMIFSATLDTSLGQGPLQILTPHIVYSCNAPIDRTVWEAITNPIQTQVVISNGGLGQNSTQLMNSDTVYRSVDGIRSLKLTRQEFDTWSRTPISQEMIRVLDQDQLNLLSYGSAIVFDNRMLMTCSPVAGTKGVYHQGLIALNLAPVSNLHTKLPPVYDGLWTGINVLQLVKGQFRGVERCFAFTYNQVLDKIELYELLQTGVAKFDDDTVPIVKVIETGEKFLNVRGKGMFDLICLKGGEVYVDNVVGRVTFQVFYKNDQYACWIPWYSWPICAKKTNPDAVTEQDANLKPQFRTDMGLPEPDFGEASCDPETGRPFRIGNSFQFKFVITGSCRFLMARFYASIEQKPTFSQPICEPICDE
jgi:hypothetical protein